MTDDAHRPTHAGPDAREAADPRSVTAQEVPTPAPEGVPVSVVEPQVEPTPVVTPTDASRRHPAGSAVTDSGPSAVLAKATGTVNQTAAERPEVLVGAAFAGGLILGLLLKRLGR